MPRRLSLLPFLALPACVLVLTGCGSSSSTSSASSASSGGGGTSTTARGGRGGFGFASDPAVAKCLKQQGVTVPQGPQGGGAPPQGGTVPQGATPPTRTNGAPPAGARPGGRRGGGFGMSSQVRAALQKCGVQLPQGRAGAAPGTSTTATTPATQQ